MRDIERLIIPLLCAAAGAAAGAIFGPKLIGRAPRSDGIEEPVALSARARFAAQTALDNQLRIAEGKPRLLYLDQLPAPPQLVADIENWGSDAFNEYGDALRVRRRYRVKAGFVQVLPWLIIALAMWGGITAARKGEAEVAVAIGFLFPAMWAAALLLTAFHSEPRLKVALRVVVSVVGTLIVFGYSAVVGEVELALGLIGVGFAVVLDILSPTDDRMLRFHSENKRRRRENRDYEKSRMGAPTEG